jgi:DNA-binding transcriptional LysR family regulator
MTLVQLKHFTVLAELGSYVAAAKVLFLTQPALTRSIQLLEDGLGQPLFDRVGRRIEITSFGRQVLAHASHLIQDAAHIRTMGRQSNAEMTGRLRLGLSSGPGVVLAVPLMTCFVERSPKLQLQISRGSTDRLIEALRERSLDGAVVDIRAMRPAADLLVTHQVNMKASFLCRAAHPLLQQTKRVHIADILRYPLASTPLSDEVARVMTERYGPTANPDDCVTLRSDDTQTLIAVARATDAVVLTINAAGYDLSRVPVYPELNSTARFGLVTLARRAQVPSIALVGELMDTLLRDK